MQQYKCKEVVKAAKITGASRDLRYGNWIVALSDGAVVQLKLRAVSARFRITENDLGYYIEHQGGYVAWLPTKEFEERYKLLPEGEYDMYQEQAKRPEFLKGAFVTGVDLARENDKTAFWKFPSKPVQELHPKDDTPDDDFLLPREDIAMEMMCGLLRHAERYARDAHLADPVDWRDNIAADAFGLADAYLRKAKEKPDV